MVSPSLSIFFKIILIYYFQVLNSAFKFSIYYLLFIIYWKKIRHLFLLEIVNIHKKNIHSSGWIFIRFVLNYHICLKFGCDCFLKCFLLKNTLKLFFISVYQNDFKILQKILI
jgi:hypothetical protein